MSRRISRPPQQKLATLLSILFLVFSCSKESSNTNKEQEINTGAPYSFEDGFETSNNELSELFPENKSRWTTLQQVNPGIGANSIDISTDPTSEGNNSLAIFAMASDEKLSKADIEKGGLKAYAGDKVTIEADFFIGSTAVLENLLLLDLECCSCWDPEVEKDTPQGADNKCPGVRLMMAGGNDFLSIERGKISGTTFEQTSYAFPRNEWVRVRWELTLSAEQDGTNVLFINGEEVISTDGMNLPNAGIFKSVFAENGIDFTLQEPVFYERVQIGATANPTSEDIEMYVDNFKLYIE